MAARQLSGRTAIVTGASSGIGRSIAVQLAAEKVNVVAAARRRERLESLVNEVTSTGGVCIAVSCDVTAFEQRERLIEKSVDAFGNCDFLVNCAGIGAMGRFDEADEDRLRKIFEVNFFAAAEMTRRAIPLLSKSADGLIVNVGSVLGHFATPLKSEYCASKFALRGLSDALRAELAVRGIDVLMVGPSTTDSEFFESVLENKTSTDWKTRGAMSPDRVAAKTIAAMKRRKREIVLSAGGKSLVWLHRMFPTLAQKLIARFGNGSK